jgi:hypothetical protein
MFFLISEVFLTRGIRSAVAKAYFSAEGFIHFSSENCPKAAFVEGLPNRGLRRSTNSDRTTL